MTYCEFLLKFARHSNWKSLSPCHVLLCKFYSNLLVTSKKKIGKPTTRRRLQHPPRIRSQGIVLFNLNTVCAKNLFPEGIESHHIYIHNFYPTT